MLLDSCPLTNRETTNYVNSCIAVAPYKAETTSIASVIIIVYYFYL